MLTCLSCNIPMEEKRTSDVVYDKCPECDAHWFDHDEILTLLGEKRTELSSEALMKHLHQPALACRWCETLYPLHTKDCHTCHKPLTYSCPRDSTTMLITYAHQIAIDVCTCCGGIWLDGSEFERLQNADNDAKPRLSPYLTQFREGGAVQSDAANTKQPTAPRSDEGSDAPSGLSPYLQQFRQPATDAPPPKPIAPAPVAPEHTWLQTLSHSADSLRTLLTSDIRDLHEQHKTKPS